MSSQPARKMGIQGIIRPPPEIRAVADRTALYVAKNGRGFETRILNSSKGQTPKFAFLHETSPFHAYYEDRIQHYEQNGTDEAAEPSEKKEETSKTEKDASSADKDQEDAKANLLTKPSVKVSAIDPLAKALLDQRSRIAEFRKETKSESEGTPENEEESSGKSRIPPPPRLMHLELVAPKSLSLEHLEVLQLTAQFVALGSHVHFLDHLTRQEWNNPYFAFCQPRHALFPYFSSLVDSYKRIKNDWTERTPVEPPLTLETALERVAYRAEFERDQAAQLDDPSARIDWHTFMVVETIDFAVDEVVDAPKPPPPPPPSTEEVLTTDDGETIRVVPTYTPKVADAGATIPDTIIDPITGKAVKAKDMTEHMRIQLLDPKWAQERKKFQDKQKETNLVSGDVVASNLERFSQQRGDRFGKKEQTLLRHKADPQKKLEDEQRAVRDQAHQNAAVGPTLPGQQKHPHPQPSVDAPDPKRQRFVYGETSMPPPVIGRPPPPPASENPFASAATGAMDMNPDSASAQSEFVDADAFAASIGTPDVTLQIRIPNDPSQLEWNYYGQIVPLSLPIKSTLKAVKSELSQKYLNQLPVNKMQLKNIKTGSFLKDSATLAALNIGPGSMLEMVPRARGGKKK